MYALSDNTIVLLTSTIPSIIGIIANIFAIYIIWNEDIFHNSFAILCGGFSITNCAVLFVVIVWMTVVLTITNPSTQSLSVMLSGQIGNGMFYASIFLSLIMAANRFCAITFPIVYSRLFTRRCAINCIFIIWIFSLLMCSPYYFDGCAYYFDSKTYTWGFGDTACGIFLAKYIDYYCSLIIILSTVIIDLFTLIGLRKFKKMIKPTSKNSNGTVEHRKKRLEAMFFFQSCLCTVIHVCGLTSFHALVYIFNSKWGIYGCTTIAWISAHTLIGAGNKGNKMIIEGKRCHPLCAIHLSIEETNQQYLLVALFFTEASPMNPTVRVCGVRLETSSEQTSINTKVNRLYNEFTCL